jgi:hypothetical protein
MGMNGRLLRPRKQSAAFLPNNISGLYLWLDASDASSVTLNSGNVSEWRDLSGGGRHFEQASASGRPQYTSGGQNGLNCLTFTGSQWMVSSAASSSWEFLHDGTFQYDIFWVWKSQAGSTTLRTLLATGGSNRNTRSMYAWHDFRSGKSEVLAEVLAVSAVPAEQSIGIRFVAGQAADVIAVGRLSGDLTNSTAAARMTLVSGSTAGAVIGNWSGAPSSGPPSMNLTIGSLSVASAVFGFAGVLCEILMYRSVSAMSAADRTRATQYLTQKWGAT